MANQRLPGQFRRPGSAQIRFLPANDPDADVTGEGLVNLGDPAFIKSSFFNLVNPENRRIKALSKVLEVLAIPSIEEKYKCLVTIIDNITAHRAKKPQSKRGHALNRLGLQAIKVARDLRTSHFHTQSWN